MPGSGGSGSGVPNAEGSGSGVPNAGGGSSGQAERSATDSDEPSQQRRAAAAERRRLAREVVEAQTSGIVQLKNTVAQLSDVVMEMRDVVASIQAGDQAEASDGDDEQSDESILRGQAAKVNFKENIYAWKNSSARRLWVIGGVRPVVWGMKKEGLQSVLAEIALVSTAVTTQVAQFSGFDVASYVPHGEHVDPALDLNVLEQLEILVEVIIEVVGKGAESAESRARVETLHKALNDGVRAVRKHKRKCTKAMRTPSNRKRIEDLINEDLMAWTSALLSVSVSAGAKWSSPPSIDLLPPVPVPVWKELFRYLDAGGLKNVEVQRATTYTRNSEPPAKRAKTRAELPCYGWASPSGCPYGAGCAYTHAASKKGGQADGAGNTPRRNVKADRAKAGRGGGATPAAKTPKQTQYGGGKNKEKASDE